MSSCKGNLSRTRPQKHQNRTAFKNDLHDTSVKTKFIKSIQPNGVCARCKDIIDWKIKYKKYKTLTAPKKCVRCLQKSIKQAYHVMCLSCARNEGACAKCCQKVEIIESKANPTTEEEAEFQNILKTLPERKRRTVLRYLRKRNEEMKKSQKEAQDDGEPAAENNEITVLNDKMKKIRDNVMNQVVNDISFSDEFDSDSDSEIDEQLAD